jgi:hypothetical protein
MPIITMPPDALSGPLAWPLIAVATEGSARSAAASRAYESPRRDV